MNFTKYIGLFFIAFILGACHQAESTYVKIEPAQVEQIGDSEFSKVILTERAIERTDIKTVKITEEATNSQAVKRVVPYSSILYDANGNSWVYTNPSPRTYVRSEVKIDYIETGKAFLDDGPSVGAVVVTQGAVQLLGTEFHVGH